MGTPSNQGNGPLSQGLYSQGPGTTSSDPFITVFENRDPTPYDFNYPVKKRWINLSVPNEWILESFTNRITSSNLAGLTLANWVKISAGAAEVLSFTVDAFTAPGTNPVVPTAGNITVTGGQVAAGTTANVIRTDSLAASTFTVEVQRSQAVASSTIGDNGVSHFNSSMFTVDANGFVSLRGGGQAIDSVGVQTGTNPVVPTAAGLITINGATVAAGTNPVRSDGTGPNTLAIEVQLSQAIASTNATNVGLSAFNSAYFTVDANGFVSLNNIPFFNYVQISTAQSPYTVLATDYYISCDSTAGAITIRLPNAPTTYRQFVIKDRTGLASTNNILVTTVGGAVTIDGLTTYTMAGNHDSLTLLFNGTSYEVY